jgi:iron uptake system EfeUOB component EfeO/EfeM
MVEQNIKFKQKENEMDNNKETVKIENIDDVLADLNSAVSRLKNVAVAHNEGVSKATEGVKQAKSEWVRFRDHVRTELKKAFIQMLVEMKNLLKYAQYELKNAVTDTKTQKVALKVVAKKHKAEAQRALRVAGRIEGMMK